MRFIVGLDGRGYYVWLPTVILDGDLDISNQIREHWGVDFHPRFLDDKTEKGYVRNEYPIGEALTISPAFLAAHACSNALYTITASQLSPPMGTPFSTNSLLVHSSWHWAQSP